MNASRDTIREEMIDVGDGHQLYTQLWGNPEAEHSVVFLHGGPGGGCSDGHVDYFNPEQHKVLFFDQRGSGKSLPYGSLENNTTQELIKDINQLVGHYSLKNVVLFGGSWGSTLALAYAETYPDDIKAMVLRGIFTGRQSEINFMDEGQFKPFFPDVWDAYLSRTPAEYHGRPGEYHFARILGDDEEAMKESAYAYGLLEGALMSLDDRSKPEPFEDFDPLSMRLEAYYMHNRCFLEEGQLLADAPKLTMPVWLVQGRFDAVCPPYTAYDLHAALPQSQLIWTTAGHSGNDRANFDVLKSIMTTFS